ncbi:MAG TPA: RuvA C-terminal domain-containing protein [Polyangiaceae bacterium]
MTHEDRVAHVNVDTIESEHNEPEWMRAHEALSRLAKSRAEHDYREGRWMLCALRSDTHVHLGFASFAEYVERLFGYKPRSTEEKLRVAEALEHLPELGSALREGALCWSAARELTRVAVLENEKQWLDVVRGKTQRQIEQLVSGRKPGDGPDAPAGPARHVLRFEVNAATLATFREAMAKLRRSSGESLDDDAALLLLARHILQGPSDEGRSSYQIAVTVCERCERGFQQSQGELVEIDAASVEAAKCDAQMIGSLHATDAHVGDGTSRPRAKQNIPPATRRLVLRRHARRCVVPGCQHSRFVDVHHLHLRSEGGDHDPDRLVVVCSAHHHALHDGKLRISGTVSKGLTFSHADGSPYGRVPSPAATVAFVKAFHALRTLGFREGETRRALAEVQEHGGATQISTEQVIRQALAVLT